MRRIFAVAGAAALLSFGLAGTAHADLSSDVASLEVAPEQRAGYDRDLFGDYDRDAILARNFDAFPRCDGYFSRYDAVCYALADFGESKETADDEVDIDHRVALAEAWDSGANSWGDAQRDEFAGDASNLNVMTDSLNASKGGQGIAEFVPTHAVCHYTRTYVATKMKWDLTVDQAEKNRLTDLAAQCDPGSGNGGGGNNGGGNGGGNGGSGTDEVEPAPKPEPVEGDLVVTG